MADHTEVAEQNVAASQVVDDLIDEITNRLQAGGAVDVEDYARRFPEYADRLQKLVPTLQAMAEMGQSLEGIERLQPVNKDSASQALGDYRIIREIGRGGMGVVFEAEQISLNRMVALKVLPFAAVFDSRHVQRFKNEALAAAQLDHPHIVNVHAVGCERKVHFYAMRYIEGETLARVIEQLRPSTGLATQEQPPDKRSDPFAATVLPDAPDPPNEKPAAPTRSTTPLAALSTERSATSREFFRAAAVLARDVARALDYAHERGVVHRDIKPSNLMLDGDGKAWVTDFGLAHIECDVSLTMSGDLLGTLRYMSPEQVLAKRVVIDHRTDIYSLGATLYELLTLQPAFPQADRQELIRRISFEDPKPPRQINPHIPRELETIVVKAMEKNPNERYETAEELADDLQRFLNNEPIKARRATVRQRITKWSSRHARVVWSAALVMLLMTLTLGASTMWVLSAYQRESRVVAQSKAVISFLTDDLLAQADPTNEPDRDVKLRTVLDRAAQEIDQRFGDSPLVKATILLTLGKTYLSLGEYAQAELHLQAAADIYQQHLGDEHPNTLRALHELGELRFHEGRMEEAERLLGDVLQTRRRILGEDHPETLDSVYSVGNVSLEYGEGNAAARLFALVLQGRQAVLGDDHPATLAARMAMSDCMLRVGQMERAQRHLEEARTSLLRSFGPHHPRTLDAQYRLASIDLQQDRLDEAVPALQSLQEQSLQSLGEAHPFTLRVQSALARGYLKAERLPDAEHLGRQTLDTSEAALGAKHRITTQARQVLADVLLQQQRFSEAETLLLEVLECELRTRGHGHARVLAALQGLDTVYEGLGLAEEAAQTRQMIRSEAEIVCFSVSAAPWPSRKYNADVSKAVSTSLAPWRPRSYSADVAAELAQQQTWEDQPSFIDRFVPPGSPGLDSPRGMTFGPDGHLYVSSGTDDTSPQEVLRYQGPLGASPGAPLPAPGQSGAVFVSDGSGGLDSPSGLKFGPDGHLYVASTGTDSVLRYDGTTGRLLDTFIPEGSGALDEPSDLAFRLGGLLYVASRASDEVLRFDAATGEFVDAVVPAGSDGLDEPAGLAFDAEGNLYVSSGAMSQVLRYGTDSQPAPRNHKMAQPFERGGRFVERTFTVDSNGLDGLMGLAFHPSGRLFVAGARSNSVYVLPLQEEPGPKDPRVSAFRLPQGSKQPFALAFDADGNLYVSCYGSHEILRYGPGSYAVFKGRLATHRHRPSPLAGERR